MKIEGACASHIGRSKPINSDNLLFDQRCLPAKNTGLKYPVSAGMSLARPVCCAVFDGMGSVRGAYIAAQTLKEASLDLNEYIIHGKHFLQSACGKMHRAVCEPAFPDASCPAGISAIAALFSLEYVYICTLGSCKAYRLRGGEFMQLSDDPAGDSMSRYLGGSACPEPYIAKGTLKAGDWYVLCSDGLSNLLTNFEISSALFSVRTPAECVDLLIRQALKKGAPDNITILVCHITA